MFFSAAIYHDMQQDVRNPQGGRGVHQPRAGSQTKIEMFSEDTWWWSQCDLEEGNLDDLETKQGPGGFLDHTCQNEEDLEPFNCKRWASCLSDTVQVQHTIFELPFHLLYLIVLLLIVWYQVIPRFKRLLMPGPSLKQRSRDRGKFAWVWTASSPARSAFLLIEQKMS